MRNSQHKEGYKETKLGWIPEEWGFGTIGKNIDLLTGYAFKSDDYTSKGIRLLRGANIKRGELDWSSAITHYWPKISQSLDKYQLRKNDLVISMDGSLVGRSYALVKDKDLPALLLQRVARLRSDYIHIHFLKHFVSSFYFVKYCDAVKTVTAIPHISAKDIRKFRIPFPEYTEQQKIADILSTWDTAIQKLDALIKAKKKQKKALMQQLLSGKKRFKEFEGEKWEKVQLNKIFKRIRRKNKGQTDLVLTISSTEGFLNQKERFGKVIAGRNIENYILLKKDEFAYNKGNSKTFKQGCIFPLEGYKQAAVPNVYYCFRSNTDDIDGHFFKYYFEAGMLNHQLHRLINKGVRNDGLLNLSADDFFKTKVQVPPLLEQQKISSLLEKIDKEIEELEKLLKKYEDQKKGLMQQLLTGQTRVTHLLSDQPKKAAS